MTINTIATDQTKATENTQASAYQLLDYLVTHPNSKIHYHASYMILRIYSDTSYLSVSKSLSRIGELFYCGGKPPQEDNLNGSILNVSYVINNVVSSAAES